MSQIPVTQIIHLRNQRRVDGHLFDDTKWHAALDLVQSAPGFQRMYWGESLDDPEHVELHIVRDTLTHHQDFLKSQDYNFFLALVEVITNKVQSPVIRHAQMKDWTTDSQALARGAPFTGTAIYLRTTPAWHEGAWPLWTHVVRNIDGCLGCSGGPLLEIVQTVPGSMEKTVKRDTQPHSFENSYIVYVGWQTTEQHHAYHRTQHFAEHSVILRSGNEGYAEYGHIVFKGGREKEPVPKL